MNVDINDAVALIGLVALCAGLTERYGWSMAAMVAGAILVALGAWRAR
jgi:hypothetical protein